MPNTVFLVYCVDTEGPLYESIEATFERVKETFGIHLEPSRKTLRMLQEKKLDLQGREEGVSNMLRTDQLAYNDTWEKMYRMHDALNAESFRVKVPDTSGKPFCINWFVMDHVGYLTNPRRKTLGFGAVFEEYLRILKDYELEDDALYFHFHPLSFSRASNRSGDNITFSNLINEIIARRIIDYRWFPAAFRPTSTEYMDLNNWLEQWIPFDFANNNKEKDEQIEAEIKAGRIPNRFIDWRGAPTDWSLYNPSSRDARKRGSLKRYIARCLSMGGRHTSVDEEELEKAFTRAGEGADVLVSVFNHDCRNMVERIEVFREMVVRVARRHSDVPFRWSNAVDACRQVLELPPRNPPVINPRIEGRVLFIESDSELWGPQPFLAVKTKENRYYHDNLIFLDGNRWAYAFDHDSLPLEAVSKIGIASNDPYGNTTVVTSQEGDPERFVTNHMNRAVREGAKDG